MGELFSLFVTTIKQTYKKDTVVSYNDDGSPAKFFITGDKHRHFDRVNEFCREMNTCRKDALIILGDAGFNYYDDKRDDELKKSRHSTLLCSACIDYQRKIRYNTYGVARHSESAIYGGGCFP